MSCPHQPWSAERWVDYLDGALDPKDRTVMEIHFTICAPCREQRMRLTAVRRALLARGEKAAADRLNERSLARIWDGVRFRIRRAIAPQPVQPRAHIEQLRSILVSICGSATADDAIRTAAAGCRNECEPFARNLGSIMETLSGDRAARLVEEAARMVRRARLA